MSRLRLSGLLLLLCLPVVSCSDGGTGLPEPSEMPNVVGLRLDLAYDALEHARANGASVTYPDNGAGSGTPKIWTVCRQSPIAGQLAVDVSLVVAKTCK